MKNACSEISYVSITVPMSTITVFKFLDSPSVWKTDIFVKNNVEIAIASFVKISALSNTITVSLF